MSEITLAIVIGNREFFPDELCKESRQELLGVLEERDIETVILDEDQGIYGTVANMEDAKKCTDLFNRHRDEIDGVLVSLPNFGDERSIAQILRNAGLNVPVLVQAYPDKLQELQLETRRDSYCGKISVCNNLDQYDIDYTVTQKHTEHPESKEFKEDLEEFVAICRVVKSLRNAKIGEVGPRPADFNTVRYSEKLLEKSGISVEPVGLLELIRKAESLSDESTRVKERLSRINDYIDTENAPVPRLTKIAKLDIVLKEWVEETDVDALAIQCWDTLQNEYGCNVCTSMSMLSNTGVPSACEVDVCGAVSMLGLQAASGSPSALLDWNNNYGEEENKAAVFHCSNFPKDFYSECEMNYANVLATTLGEENTYGSIEGRIKPGDITFARVSTDDTEGRMRAYLAEGEVTEDELDTFGGWGVVEVPNLQGLMQKICTEGFEHHTAANLSSVSGALEEAFENYLGWDVYRHTPEG